MPVSAMLVDSLAMLIASMALLLERVVFL
jgi:hypothetical protein